MITTKPIIDKQLVLHTIGNFCVDAVCAAVILRHISDPVYLVDYTKEYTLAMIITYSIIAFATLPIAGCLLDKKPFMTKYISASFIFLMSAVLPLLYIWIKIILLGIGSSMFHAAAGSAVVKKNPSKCAALGIFAAGGIAGMLAGGIFGESMATVPVLLVLLFAAFALSFELPDTVPLRQIRILPPVNKKAVLALSLCVILRSSLGFLPPITQFLKPDVAPATLVVLFAISVGIFIGGMIADKFTIKITVICSLIIAAILLLPVKYSYYSEFYSAIEQLLISISLPAILFLMCRAMPGRPGLAFGWVTTCLMLPGLVAPFITAKLGSMKHSSLYVIFIDIFFIFMPVILLFMYKSMQERVEIVIRLAAAAYVLICIFIPKLFVKPSTLTYASLFAVFINILLVLLACDEIKKTDDMIKSIAAMAAKEKERKLKKFKKES